MRQLHEPLVIASVMEPGAEAIARRVASVPEGCGLVEVRADHLRPEDVEGLVRGLARPVLVTVRRRDAGGAFAGSEADRVASLRAGLAGGARCIDVEWETAAAELAEGPDAGRVVLSAHGDACTRAALEARYEAMAPSRAATLKIVPRAEKVDEIIAVRDLLRRARAEGRQLAAFAEGRAGATSRLLAPLWGSWASYGSPTPAYATAEGQFPVQDMLGVHDVRNMRDDTRRYALVGTHVFGSPSPAMHRAGYRAAGIDARYLPVELSSFDEILTLLGREGPLGVEALAVTRPFKEAAAAWADPADGLTRDAGAANTLIADAGQWRAYNTDGPAALALVRQHVDPAGSAVAILGAGGTARAVGAAFREAGARVTLFHRTPERGRSVARALRVDAAPRADLARYPWDVLVNATPLGAAGEEAASEAELTGRLVLDAVYAPQATPLVRAARRRGIVGIEGMDLLVAQAELQFRHMTGQAVDPRTLRAAGDDWLRARTEPPG